MDSTQYQKQQAKRLHDRISSFMGDFKVGTLLGGSRIRKLRGIKPLALFTTTIFTLPFGGVIFFPEASSMTVNRDFGRIPPATH